MKKCSTNFAWIQISKLHEQCILLKWGSWSIPIIKQYQRHQLPSLRIEEALFTTTLTLWYLCEILYWWAGNSSQIHHWTWDVSWTVSNIPSTGRKWNATAPALLTSGSRLEVSVSRSKAPTARNVGAHWKYIAVTDGRYPPITVLLKSTSKLPRKVASCCSVIVKERYFPVTVKKKYPLELVRRKKVASTLLYGY